MKKLEASSTMIILHSHWKMFFVYFVIYHICYFIYVKIHLLNLGFQYHLNDTFKYDYLMTSGSTFVPVLILHAINYSFIVKTNKKWI